jgi:hypothetical protein
MSEDILLRRMLDVRQRQVSGRWRELIARSFVICTTPTTSSINKLKRKRCAEHIAYIGGREMRTEF